MTKKVAVIGVGHSRFGVRSDATIQEIDGFLVITFKPARPQ